MEQEHKEEPSNFVSSPAHHMEENPSSSKDAASESSERRVTTTTKTTITTKRQQRLANHGMGFLLQQMRNTSSSTSTTKSIENSEAEPSGKKPRLEEGNQGQLLAESTSNIRTSTEQTATIRARDDLPLPSEQDFFTNLRPLQVVSDCFCAGTTPDFGLHIRRFIGENNYVRSCKWSPDGRWLIADSVDRALRVFAFEDGKLRLHRKIPFGGLVYDSQWSPSATTAGVPQFACTSHGQPIHCWTTSDDGQSSAMTFRGTNDKDELDSAYSLCYSLDGRQLLAGYRGMLRFFDVTRPGRQVREIKTWQKGSMGAQQKGLLSALAMCPTFDGVFAVGSYGGSLGLYSTQTNGCDCLLQSNGAGPAITHLQYSSTGTQLFVGYRKSPLIKCFDLRMASTGRVLAAFRRDAHTNQRFHFQLDPHDRYLYSGSSGGRMLIYDLKKDQMQSDQMELETLANEEELLGRPANWHVDCSEAAVTGLSLHPQEQLVVAISTGQRLFPDIMAQLFSADQQQQCEGNHSPPPSDMEELATDDEEGKEADGYVGRAKGSALDNSIKLYNMMMP